MEAGSSSTDSGGNDIYLKNNGRLMSSSISSHRSLIKPIIYVPS
ncbi:hypothetical protein [Clostridium argentinense]|nr:hypothetical protein [Clostridium argentinense]